MDNSYFHQGFTKKYSDNVSRNNNSEFPTLQKQAFQGKKVSTDVATLHNMQRNKPFLTYEIFKSLGKRQNAHNFNIQESPRKESIRGGPLTNTTFFTSEAARLQSSPQRNFDQSENNYNQDVSFQKSAFGNSFKQNDNQIDITEKLKVNMGFLSFKKAKNLSPMKFQYKQEKQENSNLNTKFFRQNPQLVEFMRQSKADDKADGDEIKKKRSMTAVILNRKHNKSKEQSLLKIEKKAYGIYDRFNEPPFGKASSPPIGAYFTYNTPSQSVDQTSKQGPQYSIGEGLILEKVTLKRERKRQNGFSFGVNKRAVDSTYASYGINPLGPGHYNSVEKQTTLENQSPIFTFSKDRKSRGSVFDDQSSKEKGVLDLTQLESNMLIEEECSDDQKKYKKNHFKQLQTTRLGVGNSQGLRCERELTNQIKGNLHSSLSGDVSFRTNFESSRGKLMKAKFSKVYQKKVAILDFEKYEFPDNIISRSKDSSLNQSQVDIIVRNIQETRCHTSENRHRRIKLQSSQVVARIDLVKKKQEEKKAGRYFELVNKLQNKERRHYSNTHPNEKDEETFGVQNGWAAVNILNAFLQQTAEKFVNKVMVQERSHKLVRLISLMFRVVGRFRILLRKVKTKRALRKLKSFVKVYVKRWLSRRKKLYKLRVASFVQQKMQQPYIFDLLTSIYEKICLIQRCVKFFLKRRKLLYAFNCRNWVIHEVEIIKESSKRAAKEEVKLDQISHAEMASMTQTLPKVKLMFIREYFKMEYKRLIKVKKEYEEMKAEVNDKYEKKVRKQQFVHLIQDIKDDIKAPLKFPNQPVSIFLIRNYTIYHLQSIASEELKELIKDTLGHKSFWNDYLQKKRKPSDLLQKSLRKKVQVDIAKIHKAKAELMLHIDEL